MIGHRFDLDVTAAVTELSVDRALDVLAPALDAGLIEADPDRLGRFAFSHALVAETLAAEQNAIRRARVHAAATRALESFRGPDLDPVMADLAFHAVEGAAAGTAPAAVEYSVRAAELATMARAHGNAAAHWASAVRALEVDRARRSGEAPAAAVCAGTGVRCRWRRARRARVAVRRRRTGRLPG